METVIRLRLSELSEETFARLKKILSESADNADHEINILIQSEAHSESSYFKKLDESIEQIRKGEMTSFTMEEFAEYVKSLPCV